MACVIANTNQECIVILLTHYSFTEDGCQLVTLQSLRLTVGVTANICWHLLPLLACVFGNIASSEHLIADKWYKPRDD